MPLPDVCSQMGPRLGISYRKKAAFILANLWLFLKPKVEHVFELNMELAQVNENIARIANAVQVTI